MDLICIKNFITQNLIKKYLISKFGEGIFLGEYNSHTNNINMAFPREGIWVDDILVYNEASTTLPFDLLLKGYLDYIKSNL